MPNLNNYHTAPRHEQRSHSGVRHAGERRAARLSHGRLRATHALHPQQNDPHVQQLGGVERAAAGRQNPTAHRPQELGLDRGLPRAQRLRGALLFLIFKCLFGSARDFGAKRTISRNRVELEIEPG